MCFNQFGLQICMSIKKYIEGNFKLYYFWVLNIILIFQTWKTSFDVRFGYIKFKYTWRCKDNTYKNEKIFND